MSYSARVFPGFLLLFCAMVLFVEAQPCLAHKVIVYAWIDGDTVRTESKFSRGRYVSGGHITVFDRKGQKLLEGTTDEKGGFSFPLPGRGDLLVVLDAGMGHRGEWSLEVPEEKASVTPDAEPAVKTSPPESDTGTVVSENPGGSDCAVTDERVQRAVERALDERFEPLLQMMADVRDRGPSATEIFGGIGYILGLVGLAAWISSRKKPDR